MKLIVTEKNDAAQKIADLLGATKPTKYIPLPYIALPLMVKTG